MVNNGSATHTSGTVIDLTIVSLILVSDGCLEESAGCLQESAGCLLVLPSPLISDSFPTLVTISRIMTSNDDPQKVKIIARSGAVTGA